MTVLPQQSESILASSSLVGVLAEVSYQEVCLLLVIGPSEQALQRITVCSVKQVSHAQQAAQADPRTLHNSCANDRGPHGTQQKYRD